MFGAKVEPKLLDSQLNNPLRTATIFVGAKLLGVGVRKFLRWEKGSVLVAYYTRQNLLSP